MAVVAVKVRMYRGLLGDCFLLTVVHDEGKPGFILIDCGILQNVAGAREQMRAVAADIETATGGFVDLLIITHEHFDHISGFAHASDILLDPDRMRYGEVWMGWTESPIDPQANELRARFTRRKLAMTGLANALAATEDDELAAELTLDLENFIGPVDSPAGGFAAAPEGRMTGARIMAALKDHKLSGRVVYHVPGNVVEELPASGAAIPAQGGLKAAILAPPRTEVRLFKDQPSKGAGKETYLSEEFLEQSFVKLDESGDGLEFDRSPPFAPRFHHQLTVGPDGGEPWAGQPGTVRKWLYDHYFAQSDAEDRLQDYRTIDDVWTGSVSSLALKLDSDTNNTSLVVAFRLPDGKFLLFAADAQVGNWLSWHDQAYAFAAETVTAADILKRTVLYKVGHHCSHNATLKAKGLELMADEGLIAMIPTVEAIAHGQGKPPGWQMPHQGILQELLTRCKGRVLRGDRRWNEDPDTAPFRPDRDFENRLDERDALYVEVTVYER